MNLHVVGQPPITVARQVLTADINIWVSPLSWAVVPSDVVLMDSPQPVVLYSLLIGSGFLVDQGIVLASPEVVATRVFNLMSKPLRIRRGDQLGLLVSLLSGETHADQTPLVLSPPIGPQSSARRRARPRDESHQPAPPDGGPDGDHG